MKRRGAVLVVCAVGVMQILGCGGSDIGEAAPTPGPSSTPVPPAAHAVLPFVTLRWGERSRAVGNLNSALSATVRLEGAKRDGSDLTFLVNRVSVPATYAVTVRAPDAARVGQWPFSVTFHAEPDGAGALVGVAQAVVELAADGSLPDVSVATTIAHLEMEAGQQVRIGERRELTWTARDAAGALVAVTPGSGLFFVASGTQQLRVRDGLAEGLTPGEASVLVRVDGVISAAMPVQVTSDAVVSIAPNPAVVNVGGSVDFRAQVSGTADQSVRWSIAEVGGGSITLYGRYTAPFVAGVYAVRATSVYDPLKSATASVIVQDGSAGVGGEFPPSGSVGVEVD